MKNVTILQSVQEMQKNPLEKADFCGVMRDYSCELNASNISPRRILFVFHHVSMTNSCVHSSILKVLAGSSSGILSVTAFLYTRHPDSVSTDTIGVLPEKASLMCNHLCIKSTHHPPVGNFTISSISLKAILCIFH